MSENVEVHKTNDQTDSSAGQEVEVVPHDDKNILKSDRYHLQGAWRGRLPNDVPFSLAFVNDRVVFFGPDGYQKAASFDLETTGKPRTGMLRVIDSNGITALRLNWDRSEYWLLEENDQLRPELLQVASNSFKGAFTYLTRVKQPHNEVELAAVKFLEKLNNEPIRLSFHTANPFATEKTELEDLKYDEQPFITNRDFVSIRVTENRHGHSLNVTLNELAGEKMRYYTKQHVGSKLVVKFDGKVVTAPRINSEIGTRITIEGDFTEEQLREIATDLVPMSRIDRRTQSEDNLRTLGLGLHNYESVFQKLPAANHRGKDWKHSFSWRVAILPYIDQKKLYQQFRFNEPWDSEHNLEVAKEMPDAFRLPGDDPESFHTHYLAVSGKRTILGTDKPIGLAQVVDGTSCTLMVIQDERKVVWTQPEDFEVTDESIQELASRSDPNFTFLVGDGSVHTIRRNKIDVDELKNLLLRDDGNTVDYENLSGPKDPFDDPGSFVDGVEPVQEGLPLNVPQLFEKVKPPMKMLDGPVQDRRR